MTLTRRGAWFTDSYQPQLYFVPFDERRPSTSFRVLRLSGPAAALSGQINLNGIRAVDDGTLPVVAHSTQGCRNRVDPTTGASAVIAGISVPVQKVITNKPFQVPTTAALFDDRLAVVNAKFDTGLPPTAGRYEVVILRA